MKNKHKLLNQISFGKTGRMSDDNVAAMEGKAKANATKYVHLCMHVYVYMQQILVCITNQTCMHTCIYIYICWCGKIL